MAIFGLIVGVIMLMLRCRYFMLYGVTWAGIIMAVTEVVWKKEELKTTKEKLMYFTLRSAYFVSLALVGTVAQIIK